MMAKRIFLSSPTMNGQEMAYIQEAFDTNWIAPLGANVNGFEQEMAAYIGVGHAAALSAGTAALHLAVLLAGVKQGDVVLCSDLTFAATVNPVAYEKATCVFVDSERGSWNMDPDALRRAFQKYPQAKAVIVVNLYGTPAKLDEIAEICAEHGAVLIEDAAESLGASWKGKKTGTFGKYAALSFNGNKIITTSGGGMLLSDDEEAVKRARYLSTQARQPVRHYEHTELGYNYRMSNIVAGIGRGQLKTLDDYVQRKKWIYETYQRGLSGLDAVEMNPIPAEAEPNYWLSCLTLAPGCPVTPNDVIDALERENIEARPIWKPMHLQPVFAGCDFVTAGGAPVSEDIFARGVCLPSDIKNTEEDMERILSVIRGLF